MNDLQQLKLQYIATPPSLHDKSSKRLEIERQLMTLAQECANQNNSPEALFLIGYLGLYEGAKYAVDFEKALSCLEQAHEAGHMEATMLLAQIHLGDFSFVSWKYRKPSRGYLLLDEAVKKQYPYGLYRSALLTLDNMKIDKSPSYVEALQRKAHDYIKTCKELGYIGGYQLQGSWCMNGPGPVSMPLAFEDLKHAYYHCPISDIFSHKIKMIAALNLGDMYYHGHGPVFDQELGLSLVREAADSGYKAAEEWLRDKGFGTPSKLQDDSHLSPLRYFTDFQDKKAKAPQEAEDNRRQNGFIQSEADGFAVLAFPEDPFKPPSRVRIHRIQEHHQAMRHKIESLDSISPDCLEELLSPLESMPGLGNIKKEIQDFVHYAVIVRKRKLAGLNIKSMGCHMIFAGNPGTGKTHVARIVGPILYQIGLLESGHVIEADRTAFSGEYIGWSESKTQLVCQASMGGVLFVDEAYSLTEGGSSYDPGAEIMPVLMKMMEDHSDQLVVIVAGYKDKIENFVRYNPGLRSRFSKTILFQDYTPYEMADIFKVYCETHDYILDTRAYDKAIAYFKSLKGNELSRFGNARGVRNLFDETIKRQSKRLVHQSASDKESLMMIVQEDIPSEKIISVSNVAFFPNDRGD